MLIAKLVEIRVVYPNIHRELKLADKARATNKGGDATTTNYAYFHLGVILAHGRSIRRGQLARGALRLRFGGVLDDEHELRRFHAGAALAAAGWSAAMAMKSGWLSAGPCGSSA